MGAATRAQWLGKAWYFFYFAAGSCLLPYINVISFRANGMTDSQIGLLACLKPWVSAPASFAWSALADAKRAHRAIFVSTIVASALAHAGYAAARGFWAFAALCAVAEVLGAPATLLADAAVMAQAQEDGDYGRSRLYGAWGWGIFGAVGGWAVQRYGAAAAFGGYLLLMAPTAAVSCAMQVDPLGGRGAGAGRLDSGGSGDATRGGGGQAGERRRPKEGARVAGGGGGRGEEGDDAAAAVADQRRPSRVGVDGEDGAAAAAAAPEPPAGACAAAAARGGGAAAPDGELEGAPLLSEGAAGSGGGGVGAAAAAAPEAAAAAGGSVWAKLRIMLACPAATIMGFGIGVIGEFLFLYLQELGGSEALMGLTLTVTCASEIPAFYVQGAVLRAVRVEVLLHFVIFTYALRLALYWALPAAGSAWAVLPIELLHGITFGCGWGGGTVQCKRLAQRLGVTGLEATMQGIFQGLYFGVGQGLGALLGGVLMQRFGGRAMFAQAAGLTLAAWALCGAAERGAAAAAAARERAAAGGGAAGGGGGGWGAALRGWRGRRAGGGAGGGGGAELAERRLEYSHLKSKDSGPDLSQLRPGSWEAV
ncbi:MAG: major facilitator superfamily domain-containing protein [Monoraphidium minutum]|nr:MAG: major facilitator superfamily domain-containing protein [Monoraphidium minutum]